MGWCRASSRRWCSKRLDWAAEVARIGTRRTTEAWAIGYFDGRLRVLIAGRMNSRLAFAIADGSPAIRGVGEGDVGRLTAARPESHLPLPLPVTYIWLMDSRLALTTRRHLSLSCCRRTV